MKISKRKSQTRRTVKVIAKKAQKLIEGVEKKLRAAARKPRIGKRPLKRLAAARPRKRTTSRRRART